MAGSRKPQVGEVWRNRGNNYEVVVLASGDDWVAYRFPPNEWYPNGEASGWTMKKFLAHFTPPKPPLPEPPKTVWVDAYPDFTASSWYFHRTCGGSNSPYVAEYRLVEVHER